MCGVLAASAGAELNRLGLIPEDLDTVPGVRRVLVVPALSGKPDVDTVVRVDHTAQMPPVGNQGAQGSCVAWAVGYYQKTHTEGIEHGWEVSDPHFQFSPAFLYNQVNGGVDRGTSGTAVMKLVCEQGAANMCLAPYNQHDPVSWPSEQAYEAALPFRGLEPCYIWAGDTEGINNVRQHLANGYTGIVGIQVWSNFDNIRSFRNTYCSSERYGTMRGWHAVCIVGYDDTMTTSDGPGAFRVVNSWGTGWGDHGYFWMSYVAVMDQMMGGRQLEFPTDRVAYEPVLVTRLRIEHPTRERIGLQLGVGSPEQPLWWHDFRTWRDAGADYPFPDFAIPFDLTDGAGFVRGGPGDSVFVTAWDELPDVQCGRIESFSVEHRVWQTSARSDDPPVVIPEDGNVASATVHIPSLGIAETAEPAAVGACLPTLIGRVLHVPARAFTPPASLFSLSGRKVMYLSRGANDLRHLSPGVYVVRRGTETHRFVVPR